MEQRLEVMEKGRLEFGGEAGSQPATIAMPKVRRMRWTLVLGKCKL